ncbi:SGNH/GDSL hydrolase family protein [Blastococcus xanthinilyticus]|uniref:Lysophospholipase L1-like esterase n=1 Tax=Blastococcus xanthinilyticus TaxID=1564164 RepID=A0A5S5CTU9_9ACTN|nr:SGNH/GDSL hydrolase family protein [Blastococcus xanthinilyticus]TYP87231.1 lysophospholipase L1-like esterase [Blastococcus xanthinilyticus]
MVGGLPPTPRWAWVVMALSVVVVGALAYLIVNRPPPPGFTASASAGTTAGGAEATAEPENLRVLVVGDGTTAAPEGTAGWPQLVGEAIAASGERTVEVQVAAADGSGYLVAPPDGSTFAQLAEGAGGNWDVVVFAGSRNDNAAAPDVQAAAQAAFDAARAASPEADLLAVGPAWPTIPAPGYVQTNRDAVSAAAEAAGVPFVDPIAGAWLTDPARIGPDGETPTQDGQQFLADQLLPRIEELAPAGG